MKKAIKIFFVMSVLLVGFTNSTKADGEDSVCGEFTIDCGEGRGTVIFNCGDSTGEVVGEVIDFAMDFCS